MSIDVAGAALRSIPMKLSMLRSAIGPARLLRSTAV